MAPEQAGVLQARARTLLAFPAGKSAMILYASSGVDETLRRYLASAGKLQLTRAAAAGARLIRFGVSAQPDVELQRLLGQFTARFGAPPPGNASLSDSSNKDDVQGDRKSDPNSDRKSDPNDDR